MLINGLEKHDENTKRRGELRWTKGTPRATAPEQFADGEEQGG